jgi:hypothetical protein
VLRVKDARLQSEARSSRRRGSTHVVCPLAARTVFGFLLPRQRSSYKLSTCP